MRPCEPFLQQRGLLLGEHGYTADPGQVERGPDGSFIFYHYTRPERLDAIFAEDSGLWARLPVVEADQEPDYLDYLVEGFLEPLPRWLTHCPYFGDLGAEMMRQYIGTLLLRIQVPADFPGLYVADYAHILECKQSERRGQTALDLGYDCRTGHEVCRAEVNSYVVLSRYRGGHIAPNVKAVRRGEGLAIPNQYLSIHAYQPLAAF